MLKIKIIVGYEDGNIETYILYKQFNNNQDAVDYINTITDSIKDSKILLQLKDNEFELINFDKVINITFEIYEHKELGC